MKVELISVTDDALSLLLYTKNTRKTEGETFEETCRKPFHLKLIELQKVLATIRGSWEFVDYVFEIEGVTRAFTHQLVRHRTGVSFAQQSQRLQVSNFKVEATATAEKSETYREAVDGLKNTYFKLLEEGVDPQDARGILPTNTTTSILMKINLRAFADLCEKRLCTRAQKEFQLVVREMVKCVLEIHPWLKGVLAPACCVQGTCPFKDCGNFCPIKSAVPGLVFEAKANANKATDFYSEMQNREFCPSIQPKR